MSPLADIRGLLFDRDGTLIDFHSAWSPAFVEAADRLSGGDPDLARRLLEAAGFDIGAGRSLPGSLFAAGSDAELAAFWAEMLGGQSAGEILDILKVIFADHIETKSRPVCDLGLFCDEMERLGMTLGIATNGSSPSSEAIMRRFGVHARFAYYAGFDNGHEAKPHPSMALGFCAATGLAPSEMVMVGDSRHDLETARNAGAGLAIGVLTGTSDRAELEPLADVILDDITGLITLFEAR
jgi:phosphoglycolate phosphatase